MEILEEKNLTIDEEGFQAAMKEQKEKSPQGQEGNQLYGRGRYCL